ncbi:MAG: hypothetical protein PVH88_01840 [Ignavibacteria bacterium]
MRLKSINKLLFIIGILLLIFALFNFSYKEMKITQTESIRFENTPPSVTIHKEGGYYYYKDKYIYIGTLGAAFIGIGLSLKNGIN